MAVRVCVGVTVAAGLEGAGVVVVAELPEGAGVAELPEGAGVAEAGQTQPAGVLD